MNTYQTCRQLQNLLSKRAWPDSPNELVFASVIVSVGATEEAARVLRAPLCRIAPTEATSDPQAPDYDVQTIEIELAVQNTGDTTGQSALLGGNRTGAGTDGQGSSKGRGLLEVEEQLLAVVKYADQNSGVRLAVIRKGSAQAAFDPNEGYVATRTYTVEARTSVSRSYDAPLSLVGTALGGGQAKLTWKNPPLRFDFDTQTHDNNQQVTLGSALVLRRLAGSTPPVFGANPTGVIVQTWTPGTMPATYTDTPGAGTWSYALAAAFDETGSGTQERYSDSPATIAGLVVT